MIKKDYSKNLQKINMFRKLLHIALKYPTLHHTEEFKLISLIIKLSSFE